MSVTKEVLNIVVVGHVDHGKSTVIGRLLYDTKSLPEGTIDRVKRISKEKGKPFEYAYLLDAFEEEQKQGITIDTTRLQFRTESRDYVIIDAPGHKEFLKNMISGAASAEAALLIIDANEGIQEQSKRHGYILSLLGLQKVYVLVNKMDLIDYSQERYKAIKRDMNEFLHSLNVYPLRYIPISAFYGDNLTFPSDKMPWYKEEPVLAAIDLFEKDKGLEKQPLRFPIQDVYKFDSRRIIAGRIEAGALQAGDEILILPSQRVTKVKSIEYWPEKPADDSGICAGMSVGITVEDEFFNQRGEFISHTDAAPLVADTFKANLFWMGKTALLKDKAYKLKLATQEEECQIISIAKVIDATTLETLEDAAQIKTNDVAEVIVHTKKPLCFDEFKNNQNTGRFVIVDGYDVSGGGIVAGLVQSVQTGSSFTKQDVQLVIHSFDDYYYVLAEQAVRKAEGHAAHFGIGDVVPRVGETYEYPESFDIFHWPTGNVIQIRRSRFSDIVASHSYCFAGAPLIEAHGSALCIHSQSEYEQFLQEAEAADGQFKLDAALANQWLDFTVYRTIRYLTTGKTGAFAYQI